MTDLLEPQAKNESLASDAASQLAIASRRALYSLAGSRNVMFDEMLFTRNEYMDCIADETQLLGEDGGAHSVDYNALYRQCSRHHLDYIRRDTERPLKHSERVVDNISKPVDAWWQN